MALRTTKEEREQARFNVNANGVLSSEFGTKLLDDFDSVQGENARIVEAELSRIGREASWRGSLLGENLALERQVDTLKRQVLAKEADQLRQGLRITQLEKENANVSQLVRIPDPGAEARGVVNGVITGIVLSGLLFAILHYALRWI